MKDFIAAAKPTLAKGVKKVERDAIRFNHEGTDVVFYKPSTGQLAILFTLTGGKMTADRLKAIMELFFGMMDQDTAVYFKSRILDGDDPISDLTAPNSMMDIIKELGEEWTGKESEKSAESKPPRRATGPKSTATTRAKG